MHIHKYRSSKSVDVDECYSCGGFFIDSGELALIRDSFMNQEQEEAYVNTLIANMPEFAAAKDDQEKKKLRTQAIKGFTRYLHLHI
jgi:Zn-finger nucleic acid-binding protein